MDQFAQFIHVVGTDEPFVLPTPSGGTERRFDFRLANDLDPARTAVLMFMVRGQGQGAVQLAMWFNNNKSDDISVTLDPSRSESVRSFHEVLENADHINDTDNTLHIWADSTDGGPGRVQISDVIFLYHAKA